MDTSIKKIGNGEKSGRGSGQPSLSIIVPVYNSEKSLPRLFEQFETVLPGLAEQFELILVNDGSRDRSWQVIRQFAESRSWIQGIDLMRNYGQHNALLCGIREAKKEVIITMDDDLQHPPQEIPKLLAKLEEGYDVVYGTPEEEQHGLWRNIASKITKLAFHKVLGSTIASNISAFRAFRTSLRDAFADYRNSFVSIDVLLTWGTSRFAAVSVRHDPRPIGVSHYTFRKLIVHAVNMMTGFSTFPLQMASLVGFAFTLFGLGVLIFVILRYLIQGGSVPGFPFLASIISIFSGAQLFALGIIGEYLGRMHSRMIDRPIYTVREKSSFNRPEGR